MAKKILFVCSENAPGMIAFASSIINTLSESEDFDIYGVFVSREKDSYKTFINKKTAIQSIFVEYPSNKIGSVSYKIFPYRIIKGIKSIKSKYKIDIVHYVTIEYILSVYTRFIQKEKLYFTVHDLMPHESNYYSFIKSIFDHFINWGNKSNYTYIDNITTCSRDQLNTLKQIFPKKNLKYTHFPTLVTNNIINGKEEVEELKGVKDYILFFGRVDVYKGVDLLIDAYQNSKEKIKVPLVIAGKGLNYIANNPENNIFILNRFIDDSEINSLFSNALCVVYPYRTATLSGVLSLAYYYKKPLLVSSVPYFLENIDDTTLVFKADDLTDLTNKLNEFVLNPNKYQVSDFYDKHYSKETLINDYKLLYE